jgi:hypothetical protein
MRTQDTFFPFCIFLLLVCTGCQKEASRHGETTNCDAIEQQRIMLYQTLSRVAELDRFAESRRVDVSLMIVELYFPYYVHCKRSGKNDEGIFDIVKKAAKNSPGKIKRNTIMNWQVIQSNPLGAGYGPQDIESINSFSEFDKLADMYEVDIGVKIYQDP